jgi:Protein of unknown function (DUF1579)
MPDTPATDPRAAWMEYMTPGAGHALLNHKLGRWDLTVTVYASPGVKAHESRGTSTYAWIMSGRVQENLVVGAPDGHPFEGRGYTGFDTRNRAYWFTWFDSSGTGVMHGEGRPLPNGSGIQWSTEATDVIARGVKRARGVERFLSDNEWISESYAMSPDGQEWVAVSFHYRRMA